MSITILGAGLAGLSCSYHLGHQRCQIIEKSSSAGGHASTHFRDGAYWDEGPHVSFTQSEYVKSLMVEISSEEILEYPANVGNWYHGSWIPHPAQSNLHAVPQPLAEQCLNGFLIARQEDKKHISPPANYQEWLDRAFGPTFARSFPYEYTCKYWTCEPKDLSTDWIGNRIFYPKVDTVLNGYHHKKQDNTHYISTFRYPKRKGFQSFFTGLSRNASIIHDEVIGIDLKSKSLRLARGGLCTYEKLISTIPLDRFVRMIRGVPKEIYEASLELRCSSLLLVNVLGSRTTDIPYHWLYVYDSDKLSSRITQIHLLSKNNVPRNQVGIQVEVYESAYRLFSLTRDQIMHRVIKEIREMSILDEVYSHHYDYIPYANIIFDHSRRSAQDKILEYLSDHGLQREDGDLDPMTDWDRLPVLDSLPDLLLAGRFGQWKYFWSDDCILAGRRLHKSDYNNDIVYL